MSSTISPQDNRQSATGELVRHDSLRGFVTTWGPLALLSVALVCACAGIQLHPGARSSNSLVAAHRAITAFLLSAAPMLAAFALATLWYLA